MPEGDGASGQTSLDALWGLPPEDTGAETAARYRFQAEVIARDAIACLVNGSGAVICEWQEDAIVVRASDVELLSVKHREVDQGAWSRRLLIEKGGLRHLYQRWTATGRRARCRLATNGGLDTEAAAIRDACSEGDEAKIREQAEEICGRMGGTADELVPFLLGLRIEDGLPARAHIGAVHIAGVMRPALRRMGITSVTPDDAYDAIVRAVELASRDRPDAADSLDVVLDPNGLDAIAQTRRRLAERTLRPDRLRQAIAAVRGSDRVRLVLESGPKPTALEQKLRAGGLGPTSIRAAKALRASWSLFEKEMLDPIAGLEEIDDLAVRLSVAASTAETEAMSSPDADGTWGRRMQQILRAAIEAGTIVRPPFVPREDALMEGYLYELTDRCLIWWSQEFELDVAS